MLILRANFQEVRLRVARFEASVLHFCHHEPNAS